MILRSTLPKGVGRNIMRPAPTPKASAKDAAVRADSGSNAKPAATEQTGRRGQ